MMSKKETPNAKDISDDILDCYCEPTPHGLVQLAMSERYHREELADAIARAERAEVRAADARDQNARRAERLDAEIKRRVVAEKDCAFWFKRAAEARGETSAEIADWYEQEGFGENPEDIAERIRGHEWQEIDS